MYFYQAKVRSVNAACSVELLADLGFNIHFLVFVQLEGIQCCCQSCCPDDSPQKSQQIVEYVRDWISGHGKIFVEIKKSGISGKEKFLARVFSDKFQTACLNDDLKESGYTKPCVWDDWDERSI